MSNTWSTGVWGQNEWGDQGPVVFTPTGVSSTSSVGSVQASAVVTVQLTGLSTTSSVGSPNLDLLTPVSLTAPSALTSSIGSVVAANIEGWGRQEWGNSAWGVEYAVALTGQSTTSTIGTTGLTFGSGDTEPITGQSTTLSQGSITLELETFVFPTGVQALTELGDFDNAGTLVGWGRNGWGEEPWGDSFNKLVQLSGLTALSSSVGTLTLDLESIISPTGVSSTSNVGSLSLIIDCTVVPTGLSTTSSVGNISPTEMQLGLTGLSTTSSVGSTVVETAYTLTGVSATASVGEVEIVQSPIIYPTGLSATASVGSISLPEMQVGLTGLSTTASTGTLTPADVMGLTGVEATSSVNADGLILRYYGKLDPKTSTGYTTETPKTSVSGYSTKTPKNTTGYATKTPA